MKRPFGMVLELRLCRVAMLPAVPSSRCEFPASIASDSRRRPQRMPFRKWTAARKTGQCLWITILRQIRVWLPRYCLHRQRFSQATGTVIFSPEEK